MEETTNKSRIIRQLVKRGMERGLLTIHDVPLVCNILFGLLEVSNPEKDPGEDRVPEPLDLLRQLHRLLQEEGHPWGLLAEEKYISRVMGVLTPRNQDVLTRFLEKEASQGIEEASDWFYRFSSDTLYIRHDLVEQNPRWETSSPYGDLEITINCSKPEKDPREIQEARQRPASSYPPCPLCLENVGYWGHPGHPERSNHRVIPMDILGEPWFLQFSPYVYYHQHCILVSQKHRPMAITSTTIPRIGAFLDRFPQLFLGSNADLPLVGGSILGHDHFQGGKHAFPIEKASPWGSGHSGEMVLEALTWPLSVLRLRSRDFRLLEAWGNAVLHLWRSYKDEEFALYPHSTTPQGQEPHNTLTIIGRSRGAEKEIDLVLRNNRCTPERPQGLFHVHPRRHHIKKENIGLIEVMGLAVLPGRLKKEMAMLGEILTAQEKISNLPESFPHFSWLESLQKRYPVPLEEGVATQVLQEECGQIFGAALEDCGVFPRTAQGKDGLGRFLKALEDFSEQPLNFRQI